MEATLLTNRNLLITNDYFVNGLTQLAIAAKYDLSRPRITQILQNDTKELQEFKDKAIKKQFELLDSAGEVVEHHLKSNNLKAAGLVYKNTGITPSHTQVNINKLIGQDNRTQTVQIDGLQEFMAHKYKDIGSKPDADKVIDVTPDKEQGDEG